MITNEINYDYLTYYFTGNKGTKRSDDFKNGTEFFRKIQSPVMNLEEAKKQQNVFKSNLKEISKEKLESQKQKMTIKNFRSCYKII